MLLVLELLDFCASGCKAGANRLAI
jgi:hypothetical protein